MLSRGNWVITCQKAELNPAVMLMVVKICIHFSVQENVREDKNTQLKTAWIH